MKKILALTLALCMTLGMLSGCATEEKPAGGESAGTNQEQSSGGQTGGDTKEEAKASNINVAMG